MRFIHAKKGYSRIVTTESMGCGGSGGGWRRLAEVNQKKNKKVVSPKRKPDL
jgi:hypothetical protein